MSSEFQHSLLGNQIADAYVQVAYNSKVIIRHGKIVMYIIT